MPIGCRPLRQMDLVGGNDHPAAGDLLADQLGRELLAAGDRLHLGGDDAGAGLLDLRHVAIVAAFCPVSRSRRLPSVDGGGVECRGHLSQSS